MTIAAHELTRRPYRFKARVHVLENHQGKVTLRGGEERNVSTDSILLVPEQSTEADSFMSAWLPETPDEQFEVIGFIPHPVNSPVRLKIARRNPLDRHGKPFYLFDKHHLFVMSEGVREDLLSLSKKRGFVKRFMPFTIEVQIRGENEEEMESFADNAKG